MNNFELKDGEAELVIAVLTYLEDHLSYCPHDEIAAALKDLRGFRSRLIVEWLVNMKRAQGKS